MFITAQMKEQLTFRFKHIAEGKLIRWPAFYHWIVEAEISQSGTLGQIRRRPLQPVR